MEIISIIFLNLLDKVVDFFENESLGKLLLMIGLPILGIIISIAGLIKKKKKIGKVKSTFSKEIIEERKEFFIANHFEINGGYSSIKEGDNSVNPKINLDRFIKNVFTGSQKLYFLEGGTGIGKTSFMINLFLHYYTKSRWKFWKKDPILLLVNFSGLSAIGMEKHNILKYYTDERLREKVILLIDGMDEFSQRPGSDNYWKVFEENWENLSRDLQQFKKVIITVRNQFFEQDTVDNIFLRNLHNSPFSPRSIKLHQLDDKQADWFLEAKFKKEKFDRKYKKIESLIKLFRYRKYDFAHIPLVLSYMGDIVEHYSPDNASAISQYSIFDAIVQSWIKREVEEKIGSSDGYKKERLSKNIRRFCCFLAYRIYKKQQEQPHIDYKILQSDLQVLEKEFGLNQLFTFNSRSLLGKYTTNSYEDTNGGFREEYYRYGFIHKAFFEFFLLEYQYIQENEGGNVNEIDFTNHTLASNIYIIKRWVEVKRNVPDGEVEVIDHRIYGQEHLTEDFSYNYVTLSLLRKWNNFFKSFTDNDSIHKILKDYGVSELIKNYEGIYYSDYFKRIKDEFPISTSNIMTGSHNNFWDEINKKPYEETLNVIPYLKQFIRSIYLQDIKIDDSQLESFRSLPNIKVIGLLGCEIGNDFFSYFVGSKKSIKTLWLYGLPVKDESFKCLQGAINLGEIEITHSPNIKGEFLRFLSDSPNLKRLQITKCRDLSQDYVKYINFKNLEELTLDSWVFKDQVDKYYELRNKGIKVTLTTEDGEFIENPELVIPKNKQTSENTYFTFNYTYKPDEKENE